MKKHIVKPGDIGLLRSGHWLSKRIQFVMNISRKRKGLPKIRIFNHAFTIINIWGELYVIESLASGINITKWSESEYVDSVNVLIKTPKIEYTETEKRNISKVACSFSFKPTRYDFLSLIYQIILTLTGKWYGRKNEKATKRLYCSEACATWANEIRPNSFVNAAATNPLDIYLNENYVNVS